MHILKKTIITSLALLVCASAPSWAAEPAGIAPEGTITDIITNANLVNNSIKGKKLLDGSVAGAKLTDATVTAAKLDLTAGDIDIGGRLGIGLSPLALKLEVLDSILTRGSAANSSNGVSFANSANVEKAFIGIAGINAGIVFNTVPGDLALRCNTGNIVIGVTGATQFTRFNGRVGIGTTTPGVPLDVQTSVNTTSGSGEFFDNTTANLTSFNATPFNISIRANAGVFAQSFFATSDERIKTIQGRSDSAADLRKLLALEVTDYIYKDVVASGSRPQKKVVAQQVEKVFPQAVSKSTNVVPDIYKKAGIKDGWVELATNLKVGERVRLIGEKDEAAIHEVLEVRDGSFRTANLPAGEQVFVYGREVNDFRSVDYDAISMLNVSATQELAHELEAKNAEIANLTAKLAALEARDTAREARLARLEAGFGEHPAKVATASLQRK